MVAFFKKIIDILNKQEIPYMLSGSMAMSLYIAPRMTIDIDFIIHLPLNNIDSFLANFQDGYYFSKEAVQDAVKDPNNHTMFNIIDHATSFKVDFVVLKQNEFRLEEFNRKIKIDYYGQDIFVVSPEDLLVSKLIWIQELQSPKQMEDIRNLSELENLDWLYISKWITKLKLNTFNLLNV